MRIIKSFIRYAFLTGILVALANSFFVVPEWKQAVVTQLGEPVKIVLGRQYMNDIKKQNQLKKEIHSEYPNVSVVVGPGLHWKLPFLQKVTLFDGRSTVYVAQAKDIVTHDKQKIMVDNYAIWRVSNPQRFVSAVHDHEGALQRLDDFVYATVRDNLSKFDLPQIVRTTLNTPIESAEQTSPPITTGGRDNITAIIIQQCKAQADTVGIEILDVRIRRADLPDENEQAVFGRMVEERTRISKKYRASGNEAMENTKAKADQDVQKILAEAERDSQQIKGAADAQAAKTYADAYTNNKDFYAFTKSLETFEKSVSTDTTLILSPDKGAFRFVHSRD